MNVWGRRSGVNLSSQKFYQSRERLERSFQFGPNNRPRNEPFTNVIPYFFSRSSAVIGK